MSDDREMLPRLWRAGVRTPRRLALLMGIEEGDVTALLILVGLKRAPPPVHPPSPDWDGRVYACPRCGQRARHASGHPACLGADG